MGFQFSQKVLFKHCDPAGIVFYPRYFEMVNDCVEAFFDEVLGTPFEELHKSGGVPTAQISSRFSKPSRHGDQLVLTLHVRNVGRTSMTYEMQAHADDTLRFETTATLVHVNAAGRPTPWPASTKDRLQMQKDALA